MYLYHRQGDIRESVCEGLTISLTLKSCASLGYVPCLTTVLIGKLTALDGYLWFYTAQTAQGQPEPLRLLLLRFQWSEL